MTMSCLLNWTHWRQSAIGASSVCYTVCQTKLASILPAVLSYYWTDGKMNDRSYTSAVNYQAEHGIPPSNRQTIMSEVSLRTRPIRLSQQNSPGLWCQNAFLLVEWQASPASPPPPLASAMMLHLSLDLQRTMADELGVDRWGRTRWEGCSSGHTDFYILTLPV